MLKHAARLAMVLDDPELLGWLEPLATDVEAFQEKIGSQRSDQQKYLRHILTATWDTPARGNLYPWIICSKGLAGSSNLSGRQRPACSMGLRTTLHISSPDYVHEATALGGPA